MADYYLVKNEEYDRSYDLGGVIVAAGQRVDVPNRYLTRVQFVLAKTGTPTGTVYCRVRDANDHNILFESPDILDASTLTTDSQWYEFSLGTWANGEVDICVEWQSDTGNVNVRYADYNVGRGHSVYKESTSWIADTEYDLAIRLYFSNANEGETIFNFYKCTNWVEGSDHGGKIDPNAPLVSGEIFDDVSSTERQSGDTEYRKIFFRNDGYCVVSGCRVWIGENTPAAADEIYICPSGTDIDTQQDAEGYSYIQPSSWGDGYSVGDIGPLGEHPIWIKRVVSAGQDSYLNNSFRIVVGQE